jgi:signal transduction histidine kinase/CheY-like chemotaxis protein
MSVEQMLEGEPFSMAMRISHPEDVIAEQKLFAELVAGKRRSYRVEKRYVRPDGSCRWGLLTLAGIFEPPAEGSSVEVLAFVVVQAIDITDQKAQQDALRAREEELRHAQKVDGIGRLAAGVAHDFNNLLTVILGHGEALRRVVRDVPVAPPARGALHSVDAILEACERASSLTAQLLAYGRREPVAPRPVILSRAVASLQRLLGLALGGNVEVAQSLHAVDTVLADEGQIGQVVMNLVLNARDALAEGGRIEIATRDVTIPPDAPPERAPGPGSWVSLSVTDDGHGMSLEVQARMFEPFFSTRGDRPGTQGTGLGLATVQRIVTELGGRIAVESAPRRGTAVHVFLPRAERAMPVGAALPQAELRPAPAPNSVRVLVVEDDPLVRSLIGTVLLGAHYWVMAARNGEEALRFVDAEPEPFDLIVSDLEMPALGGAALAERLHAQGRAPRMLFVSGYSPHTRGGLSRYGRLLSKPFTPAELLAAVERALRPDDEPA